MPKRLLTIVLLVSALLSLGSAGAVAQDEAPEGEAPPPELCTLTPRTIAELELLLAEVTAEGATPVASPLASPVASPVAVAFEMPDGFELFDDERVEVEKDLRRAIGCFNTGDPLQVFSTYTDRYVQQLLLRLGGLTDTVRAFLATPRPLDPDDYIRLIELRDAVLLDDGRVVIVVLGDNPADSIGPAPRVFYLEEVLSGRWLVDEVIELPPEE